MSKSKYDNYTKEQLLEKIRRIEKHRYGLVWVDKQEDVADQCESELPVLHEDTSKEIKSKDGLPQNILIEGDNYHTLYTLNFTHKRKIDVIYIDPPYNTGKIDSKGRTDFKYNDRFIKSDDKFRHSSWLSFMSKRLTLSRYLLKDSGIIAISIDDNEVMNLRLLLDKVFGEYNFIAIVPTIMNLKGNQDQFGFAGTHEYTLFYAKSKQNAKIFKFSIDDDENSEWEEDEEGLFKKGRGLIADGKGKYREERQYMYFPLLIKDDKVHLIEEKEYLKIYDKETNTFDDSFIGKLIKKYKAKGYEGILPLDSNGNKLRWTWGFDEKFLTHLKDIIITRTKNGITLNKKQRPELGEVPSKKPKSFFYKPEYSSGNGTNQLKNLLGFDAFNNPKPIQLMKDIIFIIGNKNAIILDFFAGSGTTGQAVLELNQQDNGNRQFILCTNNENKICEQVTYPRIKKVIKGYNGNKPIPSNLKYYKTEFVPQVITDNDKRVLVSRSTELLCLAENTFELVKQSKRKLEFAIYKNNKQFTAIIYDEDIIEKCKKELEILKPQKIVIYVFSYDQEYNTEDFEDLTIPFDVKPIPEAILNVYRKNAKLRRK